jgi:hypothetical protein
MKYFKDIENKVYAYAQDGSEDEFIKDGLIEITEIETMDIINPQPTNTQLLAMELTELSITYKSDIYELNTSYLAAIVSDGSSEVTKQQIVRDQINQRKSQYVSDIADAKEKYQV